ncbi:MAG: hypothetical protein HY823_01955 [Acidobacteria bacterium]|nr:hypothetical protein [Acidobacteriota bacterium]
MTSPAGGALATWLARLAWASLVIIPVLPIAGRWLDPAPAQIKPPADLAGAAGMMIDLFSNLAPRAWMLPATLGLSACTALCALAGFAVRAHGQVPWAQNRTHLWPLGALLIALLLATLLDHHLPEFRP